MVAEYLVMLGAQHTGEEYVKAAHRRSVAKLLNNRSDGAIERKFQKISSVLIELGWPYIDGYKPLRHYQQLLLEVVEDRLRNSPDLIAMVGEVTRSAELPVIDDILSTRVEPPAGSLRPSVDSRRVAEQSTPRAAVNYLAMEANNRSLGRAGEEFVVRFEVARLMAAGLDGLAARVEHVALTRGDGDGFDVLSFETTGEERLIEVKTTSYGAQTPFFVTKNELAVSQEREAEYQLYRVFGFRRDPRFFQKKGRADEQFVLSPERYLARVE